MDAMERAPRARPTLQDRYEVERRLYRLPDITQIRQAFYAGARATLSEVLEAGFDKTMLEEINDDLLRWNDQLREFGKDKK